MNHTTKKSEIDVETETKLRNSFVNISKRKRRTSRLIKTFGTLTQERLNFIPQCDKYFEIYSHICSLAALIESPFLLGKNSRKVT